MKTLLRVLLCLSLPFSASAENALEQQRQIYQKLNLLLNLPQNPQTQTDALQLLSQILDYPLYSYAEYKFLTSRKDNLTFREIEGFQQRNPFSPLTDKLKKQWLDETYKKKDWAAVFTNESNLPNDKATRCITLQAHIYTAKSPAQTVVLHQPQLTELWLTGESLPPQCATTFELWSQFGDLNDNLVQQRALLAFEQNNTTLLAALPKFSKDASTRQWINELVKLARVPHKIWDKNSPFYIEKLNAANPQDKRILLAAYPNYLKSIKESDIGQTVQLFENDDIHSQTAIRFGLTRPQFNEWKKILLNKFFDSTQPAIQQWRDRQLAQIKDGTLLERRIRLALRENQDIAEWLGLMSPAMRSKDEWTYWQAKVFEKQGKNEEAKRLLGSLIKERGFYPMLAAGELGVPYQPQIMQPRLYETSIAAENPAIAKALTRVQELRFLEETDNMNAEWQALLQNASFEQKLRLSQYAQQMKWYDLQVEATIKAKAWLHIGLRLPNAYQDWFDDLLNGKKINRTFAMAIARQESAWKPYVSSSANARGLMQLLPSTARLTAKKFNLPYANDNQLFDPYSNIMLGTAHLQELYDKYGNNRILIASAYNAGPHRVTQWLEKSGGKLTMAQFVASIPFYETRGYVQNVLAYDTYYQILQGKAQQLFSQEEYNRLY